MENNNTNPFSLIDVVLYAKGHYKRTDSIWYDMALCLWKKGEGFGPFFGYSENSNKTPQEECYQHRIDITEIICGRIRKLLKNSSEYRIETIFRHISPEHSWKIGYYTKQSYYPYKDDKNLSDWEYWEAVLRAHLSELCHMTCHEIGYDDWKLFVPSIPELLKI